MAKFTVPLNTNIGNVLKDLGQVDAAIKSYMQSLVIKPDYDNALQNLGIIYKD